MQKHFPSLSANIFWLDTLTDIFILGQIIMISWTFFIFGVQCHCCQCVFGQQMWVCDLYLSGSVYTDTVLLDKQKGFSLPCMVLLVLVWICVQSFQAASVVGAGRSFAVVSTSILHFFLQSMLTGRRLVWPMAVWGSSGLISLCCYKWCCLRTLIPFFKWYDIIVFWGVCQPLLHLLYLTYLCCILFTLNILWPEREVSVGAEDLCHGSASFHDETNHILENRLFIINIPLSGLFFRFIIKC